MGKVTVSMAMFNSYCMLNYQRVYTADHFLLHPTCTHLVDDEAHHWRPTGRKQSHRFVGDRFRDRPWVPSWLVVTGTYYLYVSLFFHKYIGNRGLGWNPPNRWYTYNLTWIVPQQISPANCSSRQTNMFAVLTSWQGMPRQLQCEAPEK